MYYCGGTTTIDKRSGIHPHRLNDVCTIVVVLLPLTKEVVHLLCLLWDTWKEREGRGEEE